MARRATVINQERKKGEPLFVLDAGNSLVGDQDPARASLGQSSVTAMNMMGYDAMALGAKDLELGLEVLRQRLAEAKFAVLSANAVASAMGELVASPYVLQQFADHTIAIVGLSGGDGSPEIAVRDPLETAQAVVAEVAGQADVIILLSNAGAPTDQQIAEALPAIDLIISGGTFDLTPPTPSEETETPIWQADVASPGHAGRRMGIARLTFDDEGELVEQEWQQLALGPDFADDPTMSEWVRTQTIR